jgi:hypothetical protein
MTTQWMVGVAVVLLGHLVRPTPAAAQYQPAGVRATARVLTIGATVTPEVVAAVFGGPSGGCHVSSPCGRLARPGSGGVAVDSGLATVRGTNECRMALTPVCRPVVTVEFLRN